MAMQLAIQTGKSITEAVRDSVRMSLRLVQQDHRAQERLVDRVMAIGRRAVSRPVLDDRTPDEILGYDEIGVPRG